MTPIERITKILDDRKISKNKMLTDLGLAKNSFNNWVSRGTSPSIEAMRKIANYLCVSVDYLLTGTEKETPPTDEQWERDLINDVSGLSPERRKQVKDFVAFQVQQESRPE